MAFLPIARTRWRERLSAWWEEYYLDNPLVWALQRRWGAPPLWTRTRTRWAILWWTLALLAMLTVHLDPTLTQPAQLWLDDHLTTILIASSWGLAASLSTGSVMGLLKTLRETNQLTAVGMTRLRGAHVVYGGVLHTWLRGTLMRTLIAYLPFLWLIHTVLSGDAFVSLFTAVAGVLLWNAIVLMMLLISLSTMPVESLTREAGAGQSSSKLTSGVSVAQIGGMILISAGLMILFFMSEAPFLTLITPVAWLIALALRPAAIRRAERVLRSKEPVITPSEGRWQ